ncbi:MAG: hypothetical protein ACOYI7_03985, partial [Candidatus Excrementavichristensenella sp.]
MRDNNIPHLEILSDENITWGKFPLIIQKSAKQHESLWHYCSLDSFRCIFHNRTFRSTPLCSVLLNDQYEAKRKNLDDYAKNCYISCFSHCQHEMVAFWMNYGGIYKDQKVVLKFKNFINSIVNNLNIDYVIAPGGKKLFLGRNVFSLNFFDVGYRAKNDECFRQTNLGAKLSSDRITPMIFPGILGKHKTEHWEYEKETRIILQMFTNNEFKYLDFQLKSEIFRDLVIITNPWAVERLEEEVLEIVDASCLP